jgi:ABC-type dipeptide/oligopeptide/nickel transport system ATPase component
MFVNKLFLQSSFPRRRESTSPPDRTIVMRRGRVVETLRSADLEASAKDPYTIGLVNCVPTLDAAHLEWLPTLRERAAAASSGR